MAVRRPTMRLKSVLLPTLGRPTMATVGSPARGRDSDVLRRLGERRGRRMLRGATFRLLAWLPVEPPSGGAGGLPARLPALPTDRRAAIGGLGDQRQRLACQLDGSCLGLVRAGQLQDASGHGLQVL